MIQKRINVIQVSELQRLINMINKTFHCVVKTICTSAQDDFDRRMNDGQLGYMEVRPVCDADGYYKPYKCIPNEM